MTRINAIAMTHDEMELFFKKALSDISSRPKRAGNKSRRAAQKARISNIEENNFSKMSNFLNLIWSIGCSDEGTPV
jgi:hypothetical protein